jgi:hypothetical protein
VLLPLFAPDMSTFQDYPSVNGYGKRIRVIPSLDCGSQSIKKEKEENAKRLNQQNPSSPKQKQKPIKLSFFIPNIALKT